MPYKRTYRKRKAKKVNRSRIYGRAARQFGRDAATAYKWIGAATGFNTEHKLIDSGAQSIVASNAPGLILLNGLQRGTDYTQREGRSVKLISLQFRGTVVINPASTSNQFVRIIIGVCKQPNGAPPTALELFDTATPSVTTFLNLSYRQQFSIMYDKIVTVTPDWDTRILKFFKKFQMHTIFNSGTAGTWTDIMTNGMFLLAWSDQTANQPTFNYWTRMRFVDN